MLLIRSRQLDSVARYALRTISFYVVPVAISLTSIVGIVFWHTAYDGYPEKTLPLRVLQTAEVLSPVEARARLKDATPVARYDTRLSENPVWFGLQLNADASARKPVELPSRHATELTCWNGETLVPIGSATRSYSNGALSPIKAGFVLMPTPSLSDIVCRGHFVGPARVTALLWSEEALLNSDQHFHRRSGLLDGGMIGLALFALVIAIVNRERLYLLFSGWLCLNWRVGALSAGWDTQWLGQTVPDSWILPMRALTIILYGIVTFELYFTLFKEDLQRSRFTVPLKVTYYAGVPLLVAAVVLPFRFFVPTMWVMAIAMHVMMMANLISILATSRSRVAFWYGASFVVTILSTLSEVFAAALGARELVHVINSMTAALASSLLAGIAIAERMRLEHAQRLQAQEQLEHTYEVMPVGLFTLDSSGRLLSANSALTRMLDGLMQDGFERIPLASHFEAGGWLSLYDAVFQNGIAAAQLQSRDGMRYFQVNAILSRGRIEGFIQDVTEKAIATNDLLFMVSHDPLTKVYNRRGLEAVFRDAADATASGKKLAFAYLDLDRFKLINELYGHSVGDDLLVQVCERILPRLASNHQIGRVGGDEFVLVMPDTAVPLAELISKGIVEAVGGAPYRVGDKAFQVRCSIGLVEIAADMTMKEAVAAADQACREAKQRRGVGIVVYEANADALHRRQAEVEMVERLAQLDVTDYLFLEMQPIMAFNNPGKSLNFEVLLRMKGPDGEVIPAGRVIAAAEKSGVTGIIDRWVLTTTLRWIERHLDRLCCTKFVTMNLSGASLNDERFIQDTLAILDEYPVGAQYLCIEITESVALHDLDNTRRFIDQVRACGVRVALDDFGAGYTSFSYLKELPADVLKIDGQFVLNINDHPANVAIVEAIVSLARNLGMQTIAEWAEDAATAKTMAEIGVDYVQGFVVSRSQPPEMILAAESAASFITDEHMLQLVKQLSADPTDEAGAYSNLFFFKGMH